MGLRHWTRTARTAALFSLTLGCTSSELSVGSAASAGLNRCVGAADGCSASVRTEGVRSGAAGSCPEQASAQLEVDFAFSWVEGCPLRPCTNDADCIPECQLRVQRGAVAVDGSLWLALNVLLPDSASGYHEEVWLGHVSTAGEALGFYPVAVGTSLRESSILYNTDLAVRADGDVALAVSSLDPGPNADAELRETSAIHRFDAEGRPSAGRLDLPGVGRTYLALTDGGYAILADAMNLEKRAVAAVLDDTGDVRWSQPKLASTGASDLGTQGVGADDADRVYAYTRRKSKKEVAVYGVVAFDADGTRLWDRELSDFARAYPSVFGVDGAGNSLFFGVVSDDQPTASAPTAAPLQRLVSLDAAGEPRWRLDVPGSLLVDLSVTRTGDSYIATWSDVVHVSPDGECERLSFPTDSDNHGHVEQGPDGALYFFGEWAVGRYKPVAGH